MENKLLNLKKTKKVLLLRIQYPDSLCSMLDCPYCPLYTTHCDPGDDSPSLPWTKRKEVALQYYIEIFGKDDLFKEIL